MTPSQPDLSIASCVLVTLDPADPHIPRFLGRTTAQRQVEFAAACGCREAIVLGGGGTAEAIATRHLAEDLGLTVREVSGPHALARAGLVGERLLVLQPDLLPDPTALPTGAGQAGGCVITLAAGPGVEAGHERIDLARAWAGALVLPGALLPRLLDLPEDAEAAPALLRIALQAGLPEVPLAVAHLADGRWFLARTPADGRLAEEKWLARHMAPARGDPLSRQFVQAILRKAGGQLLEKRWVQPLVWTLALALPLIGVTLCYLGSAAPGFASLALAAPVLEAALGLGHLQRARAGQFTRQVSGLRHLRTLLDAALLAAGVLSVSGTVLERIFTPLVLLASLYGAAADGPDRLTRWRDRGLAAATVALGGAALSAQAGLMLAALAVLALNLLQMHGRKG